MTKEHYCVFVCIYGLVVFIFSLVSVRFKYLVKTLRNFSVLLLYSALLHKLCVRPFFHIVKVILFSEKRRHKIPRTAELFCLFVIYRRVKFPEPMISFCASSEPFKCNACSVLRSAERRDIKSRNVGLFHFVRKKLGLVPPLLSQRILFVVGVTVPYNENPHFSSPSAALFSVI